MQFIYIMYIQIKMYLTIIKLALKDPIPQSS